MCVCVCVMCYFLVFNSIWFALFLVLQRPQKLLLLRTPPPPPCYTTDAFFAPAIRRRRLAAPIYLRPPSSLVVRAAPHLPAPIAYGSLDSGVLNTDTAPSLLHPPDSVSIGCTRPCTWRHGGEGYWTSLPLVKSEPLHRHNSPNIPASYYY